MSIAVRENFLMYGQCVICAKMLRIGASEVAAGAQPSEISRRPQNYFLKTSVSRV